MKETQLTIRCTAEFKSRLSNVAHLRKVSITGLIEGMLEAEEEELGISNNQQNEPAEITISCACGAKHKGTVEKKRHICHARIGQHSTCGKLIQYA